MNRPDHDEPVSTALDVLLKEQGIDFEEFLMVLARDFTAYAAVESHLEVKGCLEGVAEHISEASMAYYVSTK